VSQPSLSVVLVVHNAEPDIFDQVTHLLEILTDLAPSFDLLILDDGSVDDTMVAACELARCYPQIHMHHNAMRYGPLAAVRTAMRKTTGEYVAVCTGRVSHEQLRELWLMRENPRFAMAEPIVDDRTDLPCRHWLDTGDCEPSTGTVRLLRRSAVRSDVGSRRIIRAEPAEARAAPKPAVQYAVRFVEGVARSE
jgi:hypothetical protein